MIFRKIAAQRYAIMPKTYNSINEKSPKKFSENETF